MRKLEAVRVSLRSMLVDQRSSRIWQSEQLGCLIECFTGGIVLRFSDDAHLQGIIHPDNLGMSAGYCQTEKRKGGNRLMLSGLLQKVRKDVSLHMINFQERNIQSKGKRFGKGYSNQ